MLLVPLGVFGLLAPIVGQYGLDVLMPLIKLIAAVYIGCIFHAGVTYSIAVKTLGKMSRLLFSKGFCQQLLSLIVPQAVRAPSLLQ